MRTLQEAIDKTKPSVGLCLRKHLTAAGIQTWDDITRASLYEYRDCICESIAPNSAKTVTANFKSLLHRYQDCVDLPPDWEKILNIKGDTSRKTYLTPEELETFGNAKTNTLKEKMVQVEFLIEAYTGARVSDVIGFTDGNFDGDSITYTSQKTKITATIPVSEKTKALIRFAQEHRENEPTLQGRNVMLKRIAQRAGINEVVKTRRGGKERTTPKHEVISSHTGRISFCTNLQKMGIDLISIARLAGHTNTIMTERYCAPCAPKLNEEALRFLGIINDNKNGNKENNNEENEFFSR